MGIVSTVEEIQSFLEDEDTVTLLGDNPTKFLVDLMNLLEDVVSAADDIDSAIQSAIDSVE